MPALHPPQVALALLLAGLLAGCADDAARPAPDVPDPIDTRDWEDTSPLWTVGATWEARQVGGDWTPERAEVRLELPVQVLPEDPAPHPEGGGGQAVLVGEPGPVPLQARIGQLGELPEDAVVVWGLTNGTPIFYYPEEDSSFQEIARLPIGEWLNFTHVPGATQKLVALVASQGLRPLSYTSYPLEVAILAHWVFEGSVQPQQPSREAPPLATQEEMTDRFVLGSWAGRIYEHATARTAFRGLYTPASGTDLDLGIRQELDSECSANQADVPSPEEAAELASARFVFSYQGDPAVTATVLVGYVPCSADSTYSNPGPVPYTLDLWVASGGLGPDL